jgi:hypothetical protein
MTVTMDSAQSQALLNQPALQAPNNVTPNFDDPPNNNTLADGITFACLVLTTLALLMRTHSWVFVLAQLKCRIEAGRLDHHLPFQILRLG